MNMRQINLFNKYFCEKILLNLHLCYCNKFHKYFFNFNKLLIFAFFKIIFKEMEKEEDY